MDMSQTKIKIKRHIAKAISYRFVGTLQTMCIGYFISKSFVFASTVGIAELLIKPLVYFFHERVWYKWIKFGVVNEPEKKKKVHHDEVKNKTTDEPIKTPTPTPSKTKSKKTLNYSSNR